MQTRQIALQSSKCAITKAICTVVWSSRQHKCGSSDSPDYADRSLSNRWHEPQLRNKIIWLCFWTLSPTFEPFSSLDTGCVEREWMSSAFSWLWTNCHCHHHAWFLFLFYLSVHLLIYLLIQLYFIFQFNFCLIISFWWQKAERLQVKCVPRNQAGCSLRSLCNHPFM